ncbi:hypothetical protein IPV69_07225 [Humisphaera borealis]|uniref:Uncharacterized protein n=1 Tax=Humisphaera borealis TaxID=2807512 RepID=A0A7M2X1Y5_9BACT|nr:hypothetical protein IPV69_07225 [Humisphaera borealis]
MPVAPGPSAGEVARVNLTTNLAAAAHSQPTLTVAFRGQAAERDWTFARDGSLTLQIDGKWWHGCSLPLRAARQQLKTMDVAGPVACLLDPLHGAHLRAALDHLKPTQAVLAIVLDAGSLPVLLSTFDFSADFAAHRLWFAAGDDWSADLRRLFAEQPGLAAPMQFVRLALPDAARLDPVIAEAQRVFAAVSDARSEQMRQIKADWKQALPDHRRLAVLTGSQFRLWDDAGVAIAELAGGADGRQRGDPEGSARSCVPVNADDPATGSTVALVQTALDCGAVLLADVGRADLPELLPANLPWFTWVTTPRIPPAAPAGPNDRLLIADPQWMPTALAAGWKQSSVIVAGWPTPSLSALPPMKPTATAAIIADTVPLDPPEKLEEFSSHLLLWNSIREELQADPLAVGIDADAFVKSRMRRYGIEDPSLDRRLFVTSLIWPAVMQGLARKILVEGLPLKLYGKGWSQIAGLAQSSGGEVTSRQHLAEVAGRVSAIIDARPATWRNGMYSLARASQPGGQELIPVIRTAGRTFGAIRHDVVQALAGKWVPQTPVPSLDLGLLVRQLRGSP